MKVFEIKIILGIGRVIPFSPIGDRPEGLGEILALISTSNLPAPDDLPIFFVNIDNLFDVPIEALLKSK